MVVINTNSAATAGEAPDDGQKLKVDVQFYGSIKAAAGSPGGEIEVPAGYAVSELLQMLPGIYGDALKLEVFMQDEGKLRDDLIVSVDSVITDHAKTGTLKLGNNAIVALFPAFPGGG